jgi:uncharacterized protein YPO0396
MSELSEYSDANKTMLEGGFKLSSLEVFNWGTFDGKIWKMQADGKGALITGENGSGKSTLVDAILTLLVANNKRNYNLSSGSGRRERSEATYVRGAYGRQIEGLGVAKTKFCREEGQSYSVILAHFQNYHFGDKFTLAQMFWHERGELKKIFVTSLQELSIEKHFSDFQTPQELRKQLKAIPQTQIFDTFTDYQMSFIGYFGTKSLKAMDLFNQVVAIKEVGNLSDFVRKHMLESQNVQELIDQLYLNYENLNLSHQAILQAREQLEILQPIGAAHKSLDDLKLKQKELMFEEKKIPLYFSLKRKNLLSEHLQTANTELNKKADEQYRLQQELDSTRAQCGRLLLSLQQNDAGQELEKIKMQIKQLAEQKKQRLQNYTQYEVLAKKLNLSARLDLKTFSQNREKISELEIYYNEEIKKINEQKYQIRKEIDLVQGQLSQYSEELVYLKKTKGNIPAPFIKVREDLCEHLQVSRSSLPFIAELLQVQHSEKKLWNSAIEKLLRSFGLRLLIPSDLYTKVNKYLAKTTTGIKLIYNKVDADEKFPALSRAENYGPNLYGKLEFQERSPYIKWLKSEIIRDFDYFCTEDFVLFQSSRKAIMASGLIKRGPSLHEKDDRFDSKNGLQSLLGWDNSLKLTEIQERFSACRRLENQLLEKIETNEKQISETQKLVFAVRDLSQSSDYAKIDWEFCHCEIEKLEKLKIKLMHGDCSQLQAELDKIQQLERKKQNERDQILSEMAVLQAHINQWPKEIQMCEQIINQILNITGFSLADHTLFQDLEKNLKKRKINFENQQNEQVLLLQRELADDNQKEKKENEQKIQALIMVVIKKMAQFKVKFSESSLDLQAAIECLPEYIVLLDKLQKESLPAHEKRFKVLLNKSVVNDMAAFKSTLELTYDEITESVSELNHSLKKIPYSQNSHVQLYLARSKDIEIREFNNLLRNALKVRSNSSDNPNKSEIKTIDLEESFNQIKKILDRMKKDINWCKSVTDVRNWCDFYVLELANSDGSQKNYYADSAGLSGGQKAKLAFTILASAIAFQYGLHKENALNKSFRFVVIDEAFSKSDEKNSKYAMELFRSLGLQLFVVTPKDKIHVVEPFIKNIFLTHINEQHNYSKITTLTVDNFQQNL